MKIYLNNFNLVTWPSKMAEILTNQGHEVTFIDNKSTYQPLLDYYDTCPHRVIRLAENRGNTAPWGSDLDLDTSDYYVIGDCDYLIDDLPDDWADHLTEGCKVYGHQGGCGLSMLETRIPSKNPAWILDEFYLYPDGTHPARWGPQVKLPGGFIGYPVDTSFAVYPPGPRVFLGSSTGIRSDFPYSVRHAPWHIVLEIDPNEDSLQIEFDEEYYYYLTETMRAGLAGMTGTTPRMYDLIKQYEVKTGRA